MLEMLAKRAVHSVLLILAVISVIFFTTFVIGDPVRAMLPAETPPEAVLEFREQMGFNRPIIVQYFDYISHAIVGDFGDSWWQRTPALPIAARPLPATFLLGLASMVVAIGLGVPLGIMASNKPNSIFDRIATVFSLFSVSMPLIWLAPTAAYLIAVKAGLLPTAGSGTFAHLILPTLVLAMLPMGRIVQITRASMMDEMVKQYVITARAKGLSRRVVLMKHQLRNAILPVITEAGWEFILVLSGYTIIVEAVFAWPGLGYTMYSAILLRDMPLLASTAFVASLVVVFINFAVDIIYAIANPLIRYK